MLDLLAQIDQTLSFVESVKTSQEKLQSFEDTISKVPPVIGACCQFVENYVLGHSSGIGTIHLLAELYTESLLSRPYCPAADHGRG